MSRLATTPKVSLARDACLRQVFVRLGAFSLALALLCGWFPAVRGDEPTASSANRDANQFVDHVQPLLVAKCITCHGPEKQEGRLRLDSLAAAKAGGEQGPAVVPGDVAKSLLVKAVTFVDPDLQMPPKQKLTDKEIATLTEWVKAGASWPEPVAVLFEDDPQFLAALASGNGRARVVTEGAFGGRAALGITPLQRDGVQIPGWNYVVREKPGAGEYRYLRLAWKKRGEGSVMIELATSGRWPDARVASGRYYAGQNATGWAAKAVAKEAPAEWKVETFDLWKDLGACTITGIAPTCDRGEEAFFDSIVLGPTLASLDAYRPGRAGPTATAPQVAATDIGDAFTDKRNPIYKLFGDERLDLWSLKPPRGEAGQSVDSLVRRYLAKWRKELAPAADRRTLIRRLTFDLTGLPPTADEVDAFVADRAPDAYDKLVTRLLESPRYGERQARLWLDVVRYADTNGYERDEFRPLIWQYRDYVIRAFNQDKPFDQFIREQLAGDELVSGPPQDAAAVDMLLATGFLRLGQWDSTAAIFQEEKRLRAEQLADLTNTTASAFLGLTFGCCQCHDHKYDPLSQADHYRLRAFFAGVKPIDAQEIDTVAERAARAAHNEALERQLAAPRAQRKKLLDASRDLVADQRRAKFPAEIQELLKIEEARRDAATQQKLKPFLEQLAVNDQDAREAADAATKEQIDQRQNAIDQLEARKHAPRVAMTAADEGETSPATHILYQGDFASPREEVAPGFVSLLQPAAASIQRPRPGTTGRRLALANWIASASNPWTARVFVNRTWQQHFGVGLVATPSDLGYSGARPVHQELLDWLATEFVRDGWSVKKLHRKIVMSDAYRQASQLTQLGSATGAKSDASLPPAALRPALRRLDAETLRDALLSVAGLLKPYDGGKPLWPPVPDELLKAQPAILEAEKGGDGGRMQGWYESPLEETDVRSIFLVRKRCLPIPFLQAFDLPDTTVSCARRDSTVVAPQALMLLNSDEGVRYAKALAERVATASEPLDFDQEPRTRKLVEAVFRRALVRSATAEEQSLSKDFLRRHRAEHAKSAPGEQAAVRALVDLCRAVLNLNEFAYID